MLVVGGYDTARVNGDWTTFPTFEGCPTCVVVSNMTYEYEGGSTSLMANSSDYLQVGLEPFTRTIDMPQYMWDKFREVSLGTYDADMGLLTYDVNNPPTGNITVTLSNGYKTKMLTQELFSKPRYYNEEGVYSIKNDSIIISTVTNTTDAGYVASWGMPYLTMNYLLMDHEKKQWKMAPAHRNDYGNNGGALISTICGPAIPGPTGNSSASATPTPHHHKSNVGAIVGGVIGGVLALALIICGIGYFFWRSQKKKRAAAQANQPPPGYQHSHHNAMSEAGDTRASIWTSTAPTEYSELASPPAENGFSPNPTVSGWLHKQGPIPEDVSEMPGSGKVKNADEDGQKPYMSATSGPMNDEPIEMPGDNHRHSK